MIFWYFYDLFNMLSLELNRIETKFQSPDYGLNEQKDSNKVFGLMNHFI